MPFDADDLRRVEERLGRRLTASERARVPNLAQLSEDQLRVARALARENGVMCSLYLRQVAPVRLRDTKLFIEELCSKSAG
jgi:hypothetical protein